MKYFLTYCWLFSLIALISSIDHITQKKQTRKFIIINVWDKKWKNISKASPNLRKRQWHRHYSILAITNYRWWCNWNADECELMLLVKNCPDTWVIAIRDLKFRKKFQHTEFLSDSDIRMYVRSFLGMQNLQKAIIVLHTPIPREAPRLCLPGSYFHQLTHCEISFSGLWLVCAG